MQKHFYFLLILLAAITLSTQAQLIHTVAGNGTAGFSGDGSPALLAKLDHPQGVAVDGSGNVYIADHNNNRIRLVNPSGIISTIAGGTTPGFTGDGGPATAAQLDAPNGVAVDISGNVYICDGGNSCIRKINISGTISTVAGLGAIPGFSGDGGPATAAQLNLPTGIALDIAGNIYIDDNVNGRIRKVNVSTGIITTIAGTGTIGYAGDGGMATAADLPFTYGVAVDGGMNVYVTCYDYNKVRKITSGGIISTFAGIGSAGFSGDGAPATAAEFDGPWGIAADIPGNVFISDQNNNRVRKISSGSGIINTFAGNGSSVFSGDGGPATAAGIFAPIGLAVSGPGDVYIADYLHHRIREVPVAIFTDHPPIFSGGAVQTLTMCENTLAPLNTLLAVVDIDTGQTETWSIVTLPLHGVAAVTYAAISTGGTLTPTGLTYTPTTGYSGTDFFVVRVYDGFAYDTTQINVTINPLPNPGIITGLDSLCVPQTTPLTESVTGGSWHTTNPAISTVSGSGVVTAVATGVDTIFYVVTNSCGNDTARFPFHVRSVMSCSLGLPELSFGDISVYPDPNPGAFTLAVPALNSDALVRITDVAGRLVYESRIPAGYREKAVQLNQPDGLYFLNVTTVTTAWNRKIMISR